MPSPRTSTTDQPERTDQQLIVRVPAELHEEIRTKAEAEDLSMAQLVRRAVRIHLEALSA